MDGILIGGDEKCYVALSDDGTYENAQGKVLESIADQITAFMKTNLYTQVLFQIKRKKRFLQKVDGVETAGFRCDVIYQLYGYKDGKCHLEDK